MFCSMSTFVIKVSQNKAEKTALVPLYSECHNYPHTIPKPRKIVPSYQTTWCHIPEDCNSPS